MTFAMSSNEDNVTLRRISPSIFCPLSIPGLLSSPAAQLAELFKETKSNVASRLLSGQSYPI
jgi:hypothetical protein